MATQTGSIDLKGITSAYSDQQQYFWVESDSSATWGGGAHITNIAESAFKTAAGTWGTDPTAGGYNLLMNTDTISGTGSLQLRNGSLPIMNLDNDSLDFNIMDSTTTPYTTINVATFGSDGARIGDVNKAHSVIDDKGQRFYAVNGTTQLANIGYDEGNNAQSGMGTAPYYTFGVRRTTTTLYSSSSTYAVGDMCVYGEKLYVCIHNITTPESWNASHWEYYIGNYSMAEGVYAIASGVHSHSEGFSTIASGFASHAEGNSTSAIGSDAHAEGNNTTAHTASSHAEGGSTYAGDLFAHAEGYRTESYGQASHAEGDHTIARAYAAHAEGGETTASSNYSHAEGYKTNAIGFASHTQNYQTIATEDYQTVIGKYNVATVTGSGTDADPYVYSDVGNYPFIIGNGTGNATADRSNAFTVDWVGNVRAAGALFSAGAEFSKKTGNHIVVGGIHICWGAETIAATANTYSEVQVTLPYTYQNNPICLASLGNRAAQARTAYATQGSLAGNKIYVGCYSTAARDIYVSWMTIGV